MIGCRAHESGEYTRDCGDTQRKTALLRRGERDTVMRSVRVSESGKHVAFRARSGYTGRSDLAEGGQQSGSAEIEHETEDEHPTHTPFACSHRRLHTDSRRRFASLPRRSAISATEWNPRRFVGLNLDADTGSHSQPAVSTERKFRDTVDGQHLTTEPNSDVDVFVDVDFERESERTGAHESGSELEREFEGVYSWYDDQPMVASRSDERRTEMNACGRPADTLSESDVLARGQCICMGHDRLTDPTGGQLTGTASGFDEYDPISSTDVPVRLGRTLVPEDQLDAHTRQPRALKIIPISVVRENGHTRPVPERVLVDLVVVLTQVVDARQVVVELLLDTIASRVDEPVWPLERAIVPAGVGNHRVSRMWDGIGVDVSSEQRLLIVGIDCVGIRGGERSCADGFSRGSGPDRVVKPEPILPL